MARGPGPLPVWLPEAAALRALEPPATYQAIAERLGVSRSSVYYWLNVERCRYLALDYKRRHGIVRTSRLPSAGQTPSGECRTVADMQTAPSKDVRVTVRLKPPTAAALRDLAAREDRTVSDQLRHLIKAHAAVDQEARAA